MKTQVDRKNILPLSLFSLNVLTLMRQWITAHLWRYDNQIHFCPSFFSDMCQKINLSLFHEPKIFRVVWKCGLGTYFRSNVFEAWWRRILFQFFLDRRNLVSTPNLIGFGEINFDNSNSCQISSVLLTVCWDVLIPRNISANERL